MSVREIALRNNVPTQLLDAAVQDLTKFNALQIETRQGVLGEAELAVWFQGWAYARRSALVELRELAADWIENAVADEAGQPLTEAGHSLNLACAKVWRHCAEWRRE